MNKTEVADERLRAVTTFLASPLSLRRNKQELCLSAYKALVNSEYGQSATSPIITVQQEPEDSEQQLLSGSEPCFPAAPTRPRPSD